MLGTANPIADYAETAGPRRKANNPSHGTQPGDPARAAQVLIEVIEGETMPARLLLASDAFRIRGGEVEAQLREIDAWKAVSSRTDFPDAV